MTQNENFSIERKFLNVSDVASIFRCDPETVKRQARNGKLPGFKFGKSWLFRMCDLDNMINAAVSVAH